MSSPLQPAEDELLGRIRGGDREALAEFIRRNEQRIRTRFRHTMGEVLRRVVDSEDLVSTVSRRLDAYVAMGQLTATSQQQLWALVFKVAERSIVDKLREMQRSPGPGPGGASDTAPSPGRPDELALEASTGRSAQEIMRLIPEGEDREIARGWLKRLGFKTIAGQVGMTPDAVRQRWRRTLRELRSRMEVK